MLNLVARSLGEKGGMMFFLIRFVIAVLLVCMALDWRIGGGSRPVEARKGSEARLQASKRGPSLADQSMAAARAGAEALARAAQEKCAAAPTDCIALARRVRDPAAR